MLADVAVFGLLLRWWLFIKEWISLSLRSLLGQWLLLLLLMLMMVV